VPPPWDARVQRGKGECVVFLNILAYLVIEKSIAEAYTTKVKRKRKKMAFVTPRSFQMC